MRQDRRIHQTRRGFTLIEIMVVVIVLGILAAVIIPNFAGRTDEARLSKAKSDISDLCSMIEAFHLDMRRYPTEDEGLQVMRTPPSGSDANLWKGPYATRDIPKDPWGNAYRYFAPCPNGIDGFGVETMGRDGQTGGSGLDADINSWTDSEDKDKDKAKK